MKTAYPADSDLSAFLQAAFLSNTELTISGFDLATAAAAGIERFESETGRVMLATAVTSRSYDPPTQQSAMLNLGEELAAITSVTAQGVAQVSGTDYRPLPSNAPARGRPYNMLQLTMRYYAPVYAGLWNSIVVSGNWGYSATVISDDAWMAMLAAGALWLLPEIITQVAGGAISISEADITESYGPKPFDHLTSAWQMLLDRAAVRWRRVTVGI